MSHHSVPPPAHEDLKLLWLKLPAANQQRLMKLLSRLLERQLVTEQEPEAATDEST